MEQLELQFGPWHVVCLPADGARLAKLSYDGYDLLTGPPGSFRPPSIAHGQYEDRPVYGYDDCFPSVAPCSCPGWSSVADHGDVCWMNWQVSPAADGLDCRIADDAYPLALRRRLVFSPRRLVWQFEAENRTSGQLPFQHVMHPLMPTRRIAALRLPEFAKLERLYYLARSKPLSLGRGRPEGPGEGEDRSACPGSPHPTLSRRERGTEDTLTPAPLPREKGELPATAKALAEHLVNFPEGTTELVSGGIADGRFGVTFRDGPSLAVSFDVRLFPTLNIWWNNGGYPNEDGVRRVECAIEPIPGSTGSLAVAAADGSCPTLAPGAKRSWEVVWDIE